MNYDVFISYRRKDAAEYARQIQLKLENYGYTVFLDHDELKDGRFDQRIIDAIEGSKVFIALLTPLYMSRCADAEDWVRKEIECAVKNNLHIVPVNIDRQFGDFPADCPASLRTHIGQHQYSEIFTGQHFTTTMNDLNENRLKPYLGSGSARPSALGAIVRIRPDMDCRMMKFGEEVALLQGGAYNIVRLMKGKHPLDFVSLECPTDHIEKVYVVEDNQSEDFFEVELAPIKAKRLKAIEDEKRRQREEAERIKRQKEEAKRREAERIEAERRAKAEAERKAKEEAERAERERIAKAEAEKKEREHEWNVSKEKSRVTKLLDEGKGRDGIYTVGDYYDRNGVKGVVIYVQDGKGNGTEYGSCGVILSLTESEAQWAVDRNFGSILRKDNPSNSLVSQNRGNWSMHNGIDSSNARAFMSFDRWQERFPAFSKAFLGNTNEYFWYLPSETCLNQCIKPNVYKINRTLKAIAEKSATKVQPIGGRYDYGHVLSDIGAPTYWSCNEYNSTNAICVNMGPYGSKNENDAKIRTHKVRAVRGFSVQRTATEKANEQRWRQLGINPKDLTRTMDVEDIFQYLLEIRKG